MWSAMLWSGVVGVMMRMVQTLDAGGQNAERGWQSRLKAHPEGRQAWGAARICWFGDEGKLLSRIPPHRKSLGAPIAGLAEAQVKLALSAGYASSEQKQSKGHCAQVNQHVKCCICGANILDHHRRLGARVL